MFEKCGDSVDFKIIVEFPENSLKDLIKIIDENKKKIETNLENEKRHQSRLSGSF